MSTPNGEGVTPPKLITRVDPEYSEEARRKKLSGVKTVALIVDTHGNPTNVRTLHSMADTVDTKLRKAALSLDEEAIKAIKQYKFSPATVQGIPVPCELTVEVSYNIRPY